MRFAAIVLQLQCTLLFSHDINHGHHANAFALPSNKRFGRKGSSNNVMQEVASMALQVHNTEAVDDDAFCSEEEETMRAIKLSENILRSLRRRTAANVSSTETTSLPPSHLLDIETDFYDPTTGLHSEGVWHNCLAGIASVKLDLSKEASSQMHKRDGSGGGTKDVEPREHMVAALRIANSLWEHSWDGISFQRRSWSGLWDHTRLDYQSNNPPEQPNYFRASDEHRSIQHDIAVVFWSRLVRHPHLQSRSNEELLYRLRAQYNLIADQFIQEYWDGSVKRWRTVSKSQGGGAVSRKSASKGVATEQVEKPYYRAVDQAIGLLACQEMMEDNYKNQRVADITKSTCNTLLFDFGYQSENEVRTYIGLDRNRNLWHDGWVILALASCANLQPDCWPEQSDATRQVASSLDRLIDVYRDEESSNMWHWPKAKKRGAEEGNVKYCCDNALVHALEREHRKGTGIGNLECDAFWDFVGQLQSNSEDGLVSVADVYHQVRLHPNTELAFFVLWPTS